MKKPRKRVLIPVDGSQFSLEILPAVKQFLESRSNELILLHVTEMPNWLSNDEVAEGDTATYPEHEAVALEASFRSSLQSSIDELTAAGFEVITAIAFGEPMPEIERFIAEEGVDLVAMTTHGRTGLARMFLGSVAQHLVNHAAVPVLLVRSFAQAKPE